MKWLEISWEKRVALAIKNKKFSSSDLRLSKLWITGPISEIADIVELKQGQLHLGPKNLHLVIDGLYFTKAVEENDIGLALNCMKGMNSTVLKLHSKEPWKSLKSLKYKKD